MNQEYRYTVVGMFVEEDGIATRDLSVHNTQSTARMVAIMSSRNGRFIRIREWVYEHADDNVYFLRMTRTLPECYRNGKEIDL